MSHRLKFAALSAIFTLVASLPPVLPAQANTPPGSPLRLFAASRHITVTRYGGERIYVDPGVFLGALGTAFEVKAQRPSYRRPINAWQVLHPDGSATLLPLPRGTVTSSWQGLAGFLHVTVTNDQGHVMLDSRRPFCPNGWDVQRVDPNSVPTSRYPQFCGWNPFTKGMVWGIEKGWAVNVFSSSPTFKGPDGTYHVQVQIEQKYLDFFKIPAVDASAQVDITVVTDNSNGCPPFCSHGSPTAPSGQLTNVPIIHNPGQGIKPDLVALPSWGINVDSGSVPGSDYLDFGATVWNAGPSPMVVEGFRRQSQSTMDAWQYFYRGGKAVGRVRAGSLEYDNRPGHQHWHFKQFAAYRLLDASKHRVVLSQKQAFCLAPTDAINLAVHDANWNPGVIGLSTACGSATSIWTRETLPTGWGDTYFQGLPGQSFDITNLPNGTYYIQVQANPGGMIRERTRANDSQLRKVILGGTPGARTVQVPPWHGIDTELGLFTPLADGLQRG